MTFKEWLMALLGQAPPPDPAGEELDAHQNAIADRLAKMTGGTRDGVLAEAYRRVNLRAEAESFRRRKNPR